MNKNNNIIFDNFNKTQYWSACEATPRYKLRFTCEELKGVVLHELFLRLLSLLPKEDFGSCKLSYGNPERSISFSYRSHSYFFKAIQIDSWKNFPLEISINFWISKEKIEKIDFITEVSLEENVEKYFNTYIFMVQKCLIKNLSQFDKDLYE